MPCADTSPMVLQDGLSRGLRCLDDAVARRAYRRDRAGDLGVADFARCFRFTLARRLARNVVQRDDSCQAALRIDHWNTMDLFLLHQPLYRCYVVIGAAQTYL